MSSQGKSGGNAIDYSNPENRKPPKITDLGGSLFKLDRILQRKPNAKGLAIIIGIPDVDGTDDDVHNVTTAFEQLGFAVWCEDVPTLEAICRMVESAAKYEKYSTSCRCIAFYFAGHGGSHDGHAFVKPCSLPGKAETKLFIKEGIVDPLKLHEEFYRKNDRYRLFFFDCCLSDPSRGTTAPGRRPSGNLPAGANTLVAYATSMDYESKGKDGKGGVWTSTLCKNLTLDLPITLILDITCDEVINKEIIKQGNQAPHYVSSVGIFCLKSQKSTWEEFKQAIIAESGTSQIQPTVAIESSPAVLTPPSTVPSAVVTDIYLKKPKEEDVFKLLKGKTNEWDEIGRAFGVPVSHRGSLRSTVNMNDRARLNDIISKWLTETKNLTWSKFHTILDKDLVYKDVMGDLEIFLSSEDARTKYFAS